MMKTISAFFRLLRPKQWIKNIFVLAPLIFAEQYNDIHAINLSVFAFVAFSLAASCIYILNDIIDYPRDCLHPKKKLIRPIANGSITIPQAIIVLVIVAALLLSMSPLLKKTMWVIVAYLILNIAYSFYLKNIAVIDIFCIATGFVLRVYTGAHVINVPLSGWMFITTFCLALFLATIKRKQELALKLEKQTRASLSMYTPALVDRYAELSAICAILFYSLFVLSQKPTLMISIPLVLLGIFRYWYLTESKALGESPTDTLLADMILQLVIVAWVISVFYALMMN